MASSLPDAAGIEELNREAARLVGARDGVGLRRLLGPNLPWFFLLEPELARPVLHLVMRSIGPRVSILAPRAFLEDLVFLLEPAHLAWHLDQMGYRPADVDELMVRRAALRGVLASNRQEVDPWERWALERGIDARHPRRWRLPLLVARQLLHLLRSRDQVPECLAPSPPMREAAAWRSQEVRPEDVPFHEARDALIDDHAARCGISGAGVGCRQVGGMITGEPCVVAHVEWKRPRWLLTRRRLIPRTIEVDGRSIPVDVVEG